MSIGLGPDPHVLLLKVCRRHGKACLPCPSGGLKRQIGLYGFRHGVQDLVEVRTRAEGDEGAGLQEFMDLGLVQGLRLTV